MKQSATFDSSFWINAHRPGLLAQILDRYQLHYTPAVAAELALQFPSGREFWRLARIGELDQAVPAASHVREFGPGERMAIDLALEHRDWVLLMDDQRPFSAAARMGVPLVCTPVLAVALFTEGQLSASQTLTVLARLAALQTVSPILLAAALAQLGAWLTQPPSPSDP